MRLNKRNHNKYTQTKTTTKNKKITNPKVRKCAREPHSPHHTLWKYVIHVQCQSEKIYRYLILHSKRRGISIKFCMCTVSLNKWPHSSDIKSIKSTIWQINKPNQIMKNKLKNKWFLSKIFEVPKLMTICCEKKGCLFFKF